MRLNMRMNVIGGRVDSRRVFETTAGQMRSRRRFYL